MSQDLKSIPGVGKNIEQHLFSIGIYKVDDLKGKDPEELFAKNCINYGVEMDRCLLYVYRLAVYFAENEIRDENKLKWWYWKDKEYKNEKK